MLRRLLYAIFMIPAAGVLVGLAVANRQGVTLSFDPFNPDDPAYATGPIQLWQVAFAILIAGVIIGGIAAWLKQGKWRRAHARHAAEVATLRAELDRARRQAEALENRASAPPAGPAARRSPAA
jgi:hypothetical protein